MAELERTPVTTERVRVGVPVITDTKLDIALLVLRLWTGAMMIMHGWPKVFGNMKGFTEGISEMGFPAPAVFAWAAALSELAGGLLLALGLYTRASATLVAATMFVAAFVKHLHDPFQRQELPITYLAIAIALLLLGSGRYSLDNMIRRARKVS
ncbi:MAG: DoxX family protein [bacterium]|nr:DoxX family protein [Candidatus Kapabacteria bacterium]